MKGPAKRSGQEPKGAIEMLEEAVELLRQAPPAALAAYYLGSVPFGLGFLYFWADMTRSSLAYQALSQEAFGIALLFLWMKTWQTISARILWAHLARGQEKPWTPGQLFRSVLVQAVIQPWGILAIPVAALLMLPFAWVYAFFQNVTVMGEGSGESLKEVYRKAWTMAKLWPRQNNLLLLCASGFSLFVLMNWETGLYLGPALLKEFLGIETVFTRGISAFFNTTFIAVVFMLTYLSLDPLMKAVYTLRCFYGESLYNGEDLKSDLKIVGSLARALLLFLLLGGGSLSPAWGAEASHPAPAAGVQAPELDQAIQETLKGEEYQWHMPRVKSPEAASEKKGVMENFLEGSLNLFVKGVKKLAHWLDEFFEWVGKHFHHDTEPVDRKVKTSEWDFEWLYGFLWILVAVVVCALALLLYRLWTRREKTVVLGQAVAPAPDVADERVSGNELPMDGWLQMAQELLQQGNFRLALRAFYLASLACLARQRLLTIAKFKSTLDYERELNRRGHSLPQVLSVFAENGQAFDRGWYGDYEVTRPVVEVFAVNHEKIRRAVEQP